MTTIVGPEGRLNSELASKPETTNNPLNTALIIIMLFNLDVQHPAAAAGRVSSAMTSMIPTRFIKSTIVAKTHAKNETSLLFFSVIITKPPKYHLLNTYYFINLTIFVIFSRTKC